MHKRVRNCNVVDDGIDSDHQAVTLKLAITSIKFNGNKITKGAINWNTILYDDRYRERYNHTLLELVDATMSYADFNAK